MRESAPVAVAARAMLRFALLLLAALPAASAGATLEAHAVAATAPPPPPCDEEKSVLMDFKVTNCYIEEGAVRTPEVLQEQMATFLSEDASAQAESFAATDCLKPVNPL